MRTKVNPFEGSDTLVSELASEVFSIEMVGAKSLQVKMGEQADGVQYGRGFYREDSELFEWAFHHDKIVICAELACALKPFVAHFKDPDLSPAHLAARLTARNLEISRGEYVAPEALPPVEAPAEEEAPAPVKAAPKKRATSRAKAK